MNYRILADLVAILHFLFVIFALFGAILALKWEKAMWIQVPAALWAMAVEYANIPCPATPIEKWLIRKEGLEAYEGGFIEHHILSILYPGQLENSTRIVLGTAVLLLNVGIYWKILRRSRKNDLE